MIALLFFLVSVTRGTIVYFSNKLLGDRLSILWSIMDEDTNDEQNEQNEQSSPSQSRRLDTTDVITIHNAYDDDEDVIRRRLTVTVHLPVTRDASCYKMWHKERSKCVIFNHDKFEYGMGEPRKGSDVDQGRIKETFTNLNFDVDVCPNFGYNDIIKKITELSEEDHEDRDCICVFVLTHGQERGTIHARDALYYTDQLWRPFTPDKCPSLAGKPKLFFIQACRGKQLDDGCKVRSTGNMTTDAAVASYKIPTYADFLIAHSTPEGFQSWRSENDGTWFIQSLCDVIDKNWKTTDLLTMLTTTARHMSNNYSSIHDEPHMHDRKQVPSITSMLIRNLFFNPHITEDLLQDISELLMRKVSFPK